MGRCERFGGPHIGSRGREIVGKRDTEERWRARERNMRGIPHVIEPVREQADPTPTDADVRISSYPPSASPPVLLIMFKSTKCTRTAQRMCINLPKAVVEKR